MNWTEFGVLAVSVFAAIYIVARAYRDSHPIQQTVEVEQDTAREVIQVIGQHHPSEPEEYESIEDPQLMLVHEVQSKVRRRA